MNNWNKLLANLDDVFGLKNKKKSSVKKIKQFYDEKADEHVFIIQYRFMVDPNPLRTRHNQRKSEHISKLKVGKLIKSINDQISNEKMQVGEK